MHMKKAYTFRLNPTLIQKLDTFDNSRTYNVNLAIQNYVDNGFSNSYNSNKDLAMDFIKELKQDKEILQRRLDYFMLPWYQRLMLPKP